jgi:hypothetical protein
MVGLNFKLTTAGNFRDILGRGTFCWRASDRGGGCPVASLRAPGAAARPSVYCASARRSMVAPPKCVRQFREAQLLILFFSGLTGATGSTVSQLYSDRTVSDCDNLRLLTGDLIELPWPRLRSAPQAPHGSRSDWPARMLVRAGSHCNRAQRARPGRLRNFPRT